MLLYIYSFFNYSTYLSIFYGVKFEPWAIIKSTRPIGVQMKPKHVHLMQIR